MWIQVAQFPLWIWLWLLTQVNSASVQNLFFFLQKCDFATLILQLLPMYVPKTTSCNAMHMVQSSPPGTVIVHYSMHSLVCWPTWTCLRVKQNSLRPSTSTFQRYLYILETSCWVLFCFPQIYDIKYLMKSCKNLKGGLQVPQIQEWFGWIVMIDHKLQEVADTLEVKRIGPQHQVKCQISWTSLDLIFIW